MFLQGHPQRQTRLEAEVEAADEVAKAGLAKLGATATLAHRFEPDEMRRIMAFDTRERTTAYSKELLDAMPSMAEGSLPSPAESSAMQRKRTELRENIIEIYGGHARRNLNGSGLAGGDASLLSLIELRQKEYAESGGEIQDDDVEAPPEVVARGASRPGSLTIFLLGRASALQVAE